MINHVAYLDLIKKIETDTDERRFISRVFLVNDLKRYFELIEYLSKKADMTIFLSSDDICRAEDVVPDMSKVIKILRDNSDKNILIPSIGEYLRTGELVERDKRNLHTIINMQANSSKRVWMPIFLARDLFQSVVGQLDLRFDDSIYEVDGEVSEFSATVYSTAFSCMRDISAYGIKSWLRLWDEKNICTGMSYTTMMARRISQSRGDYNLTVYSDPFEYIRVLFKGDGIAFDKKLGNDGQWKSLLALCPHDAKSFKELLLNGMNVARFDSIHILDNWEKMSDDQRWYFYIWYKFGLNQDNDYISSAVLCSDSYDDIENEIECHVFDCLDNDDLGERLQLRKDALEALGKGELSDEFWERFDLLDSDQLKMSLLCGRTRRERERIIDLVSRPAFRDMSAADLNRLIDNKYHDLAFYMSESKYIRNEKLSWYIKNYKINKITDGFDFSQDDSSEVDINEFDTRTILLRDIKKSQDAYFQWIDGMGVEWIDLLIEKVQKKDSSINCESVQVGKAILPTITAVNMSKAEDGTITGKKFDDLDSVSHIKDGSNQDYHSIIVRQFEIIDEIAGMICKIARDNPEKPIVVTADHGMSRKAALGFHRTDGIEPPKNADVRNEGRYCKLENTNSNIGHVSDILLKDDIAAFKTFNHFTAWGKAAGEIHGGALPEEILVPVICFRNKSSYKKGSGIVTYEIDRDLFRQRDGSVLLHIKMYGNVQKVIVLLKGKNIRANACGDNVWEATLPGLEVGKSYTINICHDNHIMSQDTINIKRRGLTINDEDI